VAIQDAMGWLDDRLHEFRLLDADEQRVVSIGIPTDDDIQEHPVIPGWKIPLLRFFEPQAHHASYAYDFGDDWEHALVHEGMFAGGRERSRALSQTRSRAKAWRRSLR
jgi:hypothetical protein